MCVWCVAVDCSYGASIKGNVDLNRACAHRAGHTTQRDSAIAWLDMTLLLVLRSLSSSVYTSGLATTDEKTSC